MADDSVPTKPKGIRSKMISDAPSTHQTAHNREMRAHQSLDIRRLTRDGLFCHHGNLTYSQANQPDLVVTLRGDRMVVRPATTRREQLLSLAWTHQRLGGMRAWFVCACGRRAAKLYLKPGEPFAYRACCALGYENQAESPERRHERQALEKAQKIPNRPLRNPCNKG